MKNSVLIIKETANTWTLRIACNIGEPNEFITRRTYTRLVYAIDAANLLKMHIDNINRLPLTQYAKAG